MMTSRYKRILFSVSLLFLAGAISSPWGHAGHGGHGGARIIFNGIPTENDCRICHDDPEQFPDLDNIALHHYLIGTEIPELDESTAPDAPNAEPGELYECLSCHDIGHSEDPIDFRDCLQCHPVWIVTGPPGRGDNVHHDDTSWPSDCSICHSN